jgi:hypothetical protein
VSKAYQYRCSGVQLLRRLLVRSTNIRIGCKGFLGTNTSAYFGKILLFMPNFRLALKKLSRTNALAYFSVASVSEKKSFFVRSTPGDFDNLVIILVTVDTRTYFHIFNRIKKLDTQLFFEKRYENSRFKKIIQLFQVRFLKSD